MKKLSELKEENFIAIAKLIDNNFIGNAKIIVHPRKMGQVKVTGHTEGGQCINCEVLIDIYLNKLRGVWTQNEDVEVHGKFRSVYPPTLKRVIDYLKANDFDFCPATLAVNPMLSVRAFHNSNLKPNIKNDKKQKCTNGEQ